jgi:hypothetical protein
MHDAAMVARLVGAGHPCCAGVVLAHDSGLGCVGSWVDGNPLDPDFLLELELPGPRAILWSGSLGESLFADEPRNWMPAGRAALAAFCDSAARPLALAGKRMCFRPHHRHVLSDVQGSLSFLRERQGQPFGIALSPADLLTPDMLKDADDHLARAIGSLGHLADLVIVEDLRPGPDGLERVPFGEGVLPAARYASLLRENVPAATPLVLPAAGFAAAAERLKAG